MRLIHTKSMKFEEFLGQPPPRYAILSHRWVAEEASFQSFTQEPTQTTPGMQKILNFCKIARDCRPPYDYVWVDTCCINKQDSSELMESINSMYKWYESAETCFVYLQDLPGKEEAHKEERRRRFNKSVWFQRGWTLQELLAPPQVVFYDRCWGRYDCKIQLAQRIEAITGIAHQFLNGKTQPRQASVAMKMSWASRRQTSRPEDIAYCLLGLFNVNMPILYGEDGNAFRRLQEEIIKQSDDESIFAWKAEYPQWGMLAPTPAAFQDAGSIVNFKLSPEQRMPYALTNKGLRFPSASNTYATDEVDASTALPMGYDKHTVELGCFYGNATVVTDQHPQAEELWEQGPITIRLERFGAAWRRIGCETLGKGRNSFRRMRRNGSYFGRGVQRTYFVAQPVGDDMAEFNRWMRRMTTTNK